MEPVDVVVVGAGNAGLCAALAARESGARVLVLEAAPESERGGNSRFTAGAMRVAYRGVEDLQALMPDLTEAEIAQTDFGTYTEEEFFDDVGRITKFRSDPELGELHVRRGFEANAEWRTRYLGPGWDLAKVRGTRFNTGGGIAMALEIGASPCGNWSGCHAVGWDRNAPEFGDLAVGDNFQKHSYPFGVMVNALGKRFVDEGADFRNYTYAKYGREILAQPHQFAWQVFDSKVTHLLRDEYRIKQVTRVRATTLEELAEKLDDVESRGFLQEIAAYNVAVRQDIKFDPTVRDGRCTEGLAVDKSNWANTIDAPPFEAYAVTCGITFTFGGLR